MAIDQREALIAAVRAQVEKEKAAKAAKLKKEQEAMRLAGKKNENTDASEGNKPKYKTLSAEELAEIEEKKRRKQAAELGIDLDEEDKADDSNDATSESLGMSVDIQADKSGKSLTDPVGKGGLNSNESASSSGGLGASGTSGGGLGLDLDVKTKDSEKLSTSNKADKKTSKNVDNDEKSRLQPTKLVGGSDDVKIIGDDNDSVTFKDGKTTVISESGDWKETDKSSKKSSDDDIISIVPNRTTPTNDVKSMYDIEDDGEDVLGAEISKLANYDDGSSKTADKTNVSEADKKKAENIEARKKAEEEARKKAEAQKKKIC